MSGGTIALWRGDLIKDILVGYGGMSYAESSEDFFMFSGILVDSIPVFKFRVDFLKLGVCTSPIVLGFCRNMIPNHLEIFVFGGVNFVEVEVGCCLFGF